MRARLFNPSRTAMSSGMARTKGWVLEFEPVDKTERDPLMGWTSSTDTQSQVHLQFDTRKEAVAYADAHGIEIIATEANERKPNIRANGYAENFAPDRKQVWTH